jgi:hypothetical protein
VALQGLGCIGNAFPVCRLADRALFVSRLCCTSTVMLRILYVFNIDTCYFGVLYFMQVSHGMQVSPSR